MEITERVDIGENVETTIKENLGTDENKEKDTEKVKYKNAKKTKSLKEKMKCKVLVYNPLKHFVILSIDGYGVRFDGVTEDPGKEVEIEFSGRIGMPGFMVEMK